MNEKSSKFLSLAVFGVNLAVILAIWLTGSASIFISNTGTVADYAIAIGGILGLIAFYLILWQLVLIGRVGWIEKAWGHDRLSRIHHYSGIVAVSTLLLHPFFLVVGYSSEAQTTLINQFLTFLTDYKDVFDAFVGYLMFVVLVLLSLQLVRKKLRYEAWYFVHLILYIAVILSFGHQLSNGHDFARQWAVVYWWTLVIVVFLQVVYSRFFIPLRQSWRHNFRVTSIERETPDVISIIIAGRNLQKFRAKAGQFIIVRFLARGYWWEAHPFSLSEIPKEDRLRITAKAVGDFTKKLPWLPLGTGVIIEGPLGRFTAARAGAKDVLLIAGGIGITPLRAIFEELASQNQKVDLLYSARNDRDFALKNELDRLSGGNAKVSYISSAEQGRITEQLIKEKIPDIAERTVYLCGPLPMMTAIKPYLRNLGVPDKDIIYEKFSLG